MATNALVFSLISLREEKHLRKTQINNVKFLLIPILSQAGETVRVLTRNSSIARKKLPVAKSINKFFVP